MAKLQMVFFCYSKILHPIESKNPWVRLVLHDGPLYPKVTRKLKVKNYLVKGLSHKRVAL